MDSGEPLRQPDTVRRSDWWRNFGSDPDLIEGKLRGRIDREVMEHWWNENTAKRKSVFVSFGWNCQIVTAVRHGELIKPMSRGARGSSFELNWQEILWSNQGMHVWWRVAVCHMGSHERLKRTFLANSFSDEYQMRAELCLSYVLLSPMRAIKMR